MVRLLDVLFSPCWLMLGCRDSVCGELREEVWLEFFIGDGDEIYSN